MHIRDFRYARYATEGAELSVGKRSAVLSWHDREDSQPPDKIAGLARV